LELVVAEAVAQARISLVAVAVCITRVVLEPLLQPSTQDSLLLRRWALVEEEEVEAVVAIISIQEPQEVQEVQGEGLLISMQT